MLRRKHIDGLVQTTVHTQVCLLVPRKPETSDLDLCWLFNGTHRPLSNPGLNCYGGRRSLN
jgi:hypothetical protein